MSEKIVIKNFAGIDYLDMKLEKINIIIGPQASGKSICAKTIYFFKSIFLDLSDFTDNNFEKRKIDNSILSRFNEYFPPKFLGVEDFSLTYELNNDFIKINQVSKKLKISYSDGYVKQILFLRNEYKKIVENKKKSQDLDNDFPINWTLERRNLDNLFKTIGRESTLSQLFIPAGRSFFALLQRNIFSFLSSNRTIDPFLTRFGSYYESLKEFLTFGNQSDRYKNEKKLVEEIEVYKKAILHGTYIQEKDNDYIVTEDGRKVGIANTSSGQQESLPLTIILGFLPFNVYRGYGSTVYIEEPEAHIFPDAQMKIVELISFVYNNTNENLQFIITTHSPYVLTSFNNLIFAGSIGISHDPKIRKRLNELVSRKIWLNSKDVSAYSLRNGRCECIKDEETGLINSEYLDSVSNLLGGVFDELIELS